MQIAERVRDNTFQLPLPEIEAPLKYAILPNNVHDLKNRLSTEKINFALHPSLYTSLGNPIRDERLNTEEINRQIAFRVVRKNKVEPPTYADVERFSIRNDERARLVQEMQRMGMIGVTEFWRKQSNKDAPIYPFDNLFGHLTAPYYYQYLRNGPYENERVRPPVGFSIDTPQGIYHVGERPDIVSDTVEAGGVKVRRIVNFTYQADLTNPTHVIKLALAAISEKARITSTNEDKLVRPFLYDFAKKAYIELKDFDETTLVRGIIATAKAMGTSTGSLILNKESNKKRREKRKEQKANFDMPLKAKQEQKQIPGSAVIYAEQAATAFDEVARNTTWVEYPFELEEYEVV